MSDCTHDLTEREVACADGMCPMCLAAECDVLRALVNAIVENRSKCFIPTEGGPDALLEWDERADAALAGGKHD